MSIDQHGPPGDRRVIAGDLARWQKHVDDRLDAQDVVLREIRDYLAFSKVGAKLLLWGASVGAALATILAFWHGPPK